MSKGVSPVIASILVILVALSLVSGYIVWTRGVFSTVQESGQEEIEGRAQELFSDVSIVGISGQAVTIQNSGASELSAGSLDVFFAGEPVEFSADFDVLDPDDVGTLTLRELWKFGPGSHSVKVSAGSFTDTTGVTLEPAEGITGDWRLDEGSGTTAFDSSGNGNDGVLEDGDTANSDGDTPPRWTAGRVGDALDFDGVDDSVNISDSGTLEPTDEITVSAWVRIPTDATNSHSSNLMSVLRKHGHYYLRGYSDDGNKVGFWIHDGNWHSAAADEDIRGTGWRFLVGTYDSSTIRIYLDGSQVSSTDISTSMTANENPLAIGNHIGSGGDNVEPFNGMIDEVRIYTRAHEPHELMVMGGS